MKNIIKKYIIKNLQDYSISDTDILSEIIIKNNKKIILSLNVKNYDIKIFYKIKKNISFFIKNNFPNINSVTISLIQDITQKKISIIGLYSINGGVGKSTITRNLAYALNNNGFNIGIFDADIYSSDMLNMFETKSDPIIINKKIQPLNIDNIDFLSSSLFLENKNNPILWRGAIASNFIQKIWNNINWNNNDIILVDLPSGISDIIIDFFKKNYLDNIIIIGLPNNSSNIEKSINICLKLNQNISGLIENMSYFINDKFEKYNIFGHNSIEDIANKYNIPFLADIPILSNISSNTYQLKNNSKYHPNIEINNIYQDLANKIINLI